MPPKIIAKNADRTGGVLPVNAATRANASKAPSTRLKLEVRRLPPGLTLTEFEETLGDDWKLGNGKVDWREYRQGKTRLPGSGKVPEQSRCYVHMVNEAGVKEFEKRFLEVVFEDKAGTSKNPDMKNLQPTLGFAPNQRTPLQQAKPRTDTRQGTIDQDSDFMLFLEAETQPIAKPAALDAAGIEKEGERREVKTTPLIEDLRERKANKAKAALAKAEKAEKEKKAGAAKGKEVKAAAETSGGKGAQQQKAEQAAKDAAKVLNKHAAGKQQQAKTNSPSKAKKQPPSPKSLNAAASPTTSSDAASPSAQRIPPSQRQRGNADGIKKMLQKDLGIKPRSTPTAQPSPVPGSTSTPSSPPPTTATPSTPLAAPDAATPLPAPAPTKAYLKHANPSQGMTEILIQQALSQFGDVTSVTIDPRKGTAVAMFRENEGLKKALDARRVPVAQGAVEVLVFRDRAVSGAAGRGGFRGGRGGGRGGHASGAAATAQGSPAPSTPAASAGT